MANRSDAGGVETVNALERQPSVDDSGEEDASTQRRRLTAVWLAAGSAVAFMVGAGWYDEVIRTGGVPGGDMIGHAATVEWLRTLPWWDWRGWSDWFYGGQAIGVNYPPMGQIWMRFTHPVHGQMAAVTLGLLVLLPWGALRLARAVGYSPRLQRIAVGAMLLLAAASGSMHWVLYGFHAAWTFFSAWPAMLSAVIGLFTAAWAARCHRPTGAGIVAGVALLCNAAMIPGWAAVWAVLLATSGASFRQGVRWAVTAGAATLAVSGWWLVPFLDSWDRLVRWEVALHQAWAFGGEYQVVVLTAVGMGAAWASRRPGPARRMAGAAAGGLGATLLADWTGWLRPDRWLTAAVLAAAMACAGLATRMPSLSPTTRLRPVWALHIALGLVVFVVLTLRLEVLALALGLFFLPPRSWAWIGGLAWGAILFWGGLWGVISEAPEPSSDSPVDIAAEQSDLHAAGMVYLDSANVTPNGSFVICSWGKPWQATASTGGRIRPLFGLYRESSPAAEFIDIEALMEFSQIAENDPIRPHWYEAWQEAEKPPIKGGLAAAEALGARWYAGCDEDRNVFLTDLDGVTATGATVAFHSSENGWHQAAARWWIQIAAELRTEPESWQPVPIRSNDSYPDHPAAQAATGVRMRADGDRLTVQADSAGWVWLRVPWDPYWQAPPSAAVHKGGPGHLVAWVPEGETELEWRVPARVNAAAAAVTGAAGLTVLVMAVGNRRRGGGLDLDRPRPIRAAVGLYADTVDEWLRIVGRWARSAGRASGASAARGRTSSSRLLPVSWRSRLKR